MSTEFEHGPKRAIFGVAVHTTGNGIPDLVERTGRSHLDVARETYLKMGLVGPHAVIDPFGKVEHYVDPQLVRYHVGLEPEHRRSFLDGHWLEDRNRITTETVKWWQARWPGVQSPSHLYPGPSANKVYIGVELIPCGIYVKNAWVWKHGTRPGFDNQRFSVEQYYSLAKLCNQWAEEYGLDLDRRGVLLGHEDLNVYTRPGYDPGDKIKAFSWSLLRGLLPLVQP
jgi:hypothetical protein